MSRATRRDSLSKMVTEGKLRKMHDLSRRKQETWDTEKADAKKLHCATGKFRLDPREHKITFLPPSSLVCIPVTLLMSQEEKGRDWQNEEHCRSSWSPSKELEGAQVHRTC